MPNPILGEGWQSDAVAKTTVPPIPIPTMTNSSLNAVNWQQNDDSEFAFVLETFMSLANGGEAFTGEILRASSQIKPGEFESFYEEFKFLADEMYTLRKRSKYPVSIRSAVRTFKQRNTMEAYIIRRGCVGALR